MRLSDFTSRLPSRSSIAAVLTGSPIISEASGTAIRPGKIPPRLPAKLALPYLMFAASAVVNPSLGPPRALAGAISSNREHAVRHGESDPPMMTVVGHNRVCSGPEQTLHRGRVLSPPHEMRFLQHHMDTFGAVHYLGYSQVGCQAT